MPVAAEDNVSWPVWVGGFWILEVLSVNELHNLHPPTPGAVGERLRSYVF